MRSKHGYGKLPDDEKTNVCVCLSLRVTIGEECMCSHATVCSPLHDGHPRSLQTCHNYGPPASNKTTGEKSNHNKALRHLLISNATLVSPNISPHFFLMTRSITSSGLAAQSHTHSLREDTW